MGSVRGRLAPAAVAVQDGAQEQLQRSLAQSGFYKKIQMTLYYEQLRTYLFMHTQVPAYSRHETVFSIINKLAILGQF